MGIDNQEPPGGTGRLRAVLAQARQTKETIKQQKDLEDDSIRGLGRPYDVFSRDVSTYLESLEEFFPGVSKHVKDVIAKKKQEGKKVLVVDLAGAASATSLGADRTISATLQNNVEELEGQTILAVDLLSHRGLQALSHTIQETGMPISFSFCCPVGPAATPAYGGNTYVDGRMSRLLRGIYSLHAVGGEMYLNFHYAPRKLEIPSVFDGLDAKVEDASRDQNLERNIFRITKPEAPEHT